MSSLPVPQPKKGAKNKAALASALASDVLSLWLPGAAVISRSLEIYIEHKHTAAQRILFEAVAEGNTELLNDPDYEHLVPNVLSYFEAARRGEYVHNLEILARIVAGELTAARVDPGKVLRASRRLEGLTIDNLQFLSELNDIFEAKSKNDINKYYLSTDDHDVVVHRQREYYAPEIEINSQFAELFSRGLLYIGGNPDDVGGQYYYKTEAFNEIVASARSKHGGPASKSSR